MEVCVSGGYIIRCTPDHKFMLIDGSYKEARELKSFDSLMPLYRTYQTRDGYETIYSHKSKAKLTHKLVAEYKFGNTLNYVIHHRDNNWYNNHPDNLELLSSSTHSCLHRKRNCNFLTNEFKSKKN